ncbi:MAG: Gfo/Idh/MocA family oxidoreductase [Deltaproteobacteria bacterium]|nr:Gfo/Idh/MocA family oxidoreductase [Deltaproteobacteria bacterium]
MRKNFALLGVGGFVAPRHLQAIAETGNQLIGACDPKDSVGIMDRWFPEAAFFTEFERFDRFLEKQRRLGDDQRAHFVSVCSPNYLHDAHVRLALRVGADAICEKPLVISPWNLDQLAVLEQESGRRVFNVLQLRLLPALMALKQELTRKPLEQRADVVLTYVTRRGRWYHASWKGTEDKSGGLVMNIGIHLFDMMLWLFGSMERSEIHLRHHDRVAGTLRLKNADVRWFLSVNGEDVPADARAAGKTAFRSLTMNGRSIEFSDGFTDLHTRVYQDIVAGGGYRIDDARPALELAYGMRSAPLASSGERHPFAVTLHD